VDKVDSITADKAESERSHQRRKLLKGAITTAPAVMILANRPVFGASCSISGFLSIDPSANLNLPADCEAWSPGAWYSAWQSRLSSAKNDNSGGQLSYGKNDGWAVAGYFGTQTFSSIFNTTHALVNIEIVSTDSTGNQATTQITNYTSVIDLEMSHLLHDSSVVDTATRHAAAALLNASFVQNWPIDKHATWMNGFIAPKDVIGVYLLYDATVHNDGKSIISGLLPTGHTLQYLQYQSTLGAMIKSSSFTDKQSFENFFIMLASHDKGWKPGI